MSDRSDWWCKWDEVERRIFDAVEGALTDHPEYEPGPTLEEVKWAQGIAAKATADVMNHLDGYTAGDVAEEVSRVES